MPSKPEFAAIRSSQTCVRWPYLSLSNPSYSQRKPMLRVSRELTFQSSST